MHEIPVVFPAVRMWLSWLWKQLFAAGSTQQKSFEQKTCRVPTLVQLSDCYWNGISVPITIQIWCNWVLLLSCDDVLKFDWYCQLSGSGNNSFSSWKLPDCFSYGLGMRLDACTLKLRRCTHLKYNVSVKKCESSTHCLTGFEINSTETDVEVLEGGLPTF